jgi:hypothetical protein
VSRHRVTLTPTTPRRRVSWVPVVLVAHVVLVVVIVFWVTLL